MGALFLLSRALHAFEPRDVSEPVSLKAEAGPASGGEDVINFRGSLQWCPANQVMLASPHAGVSTGGLLDSARPLLLCFASDN